MRRSQVFQLNQRSAVLDALTSAWHEGREPNHEDVENLTDVVRGEIDRQRVAERTERVRSVAVAVSQSGSLRQA